jgi:hypothetical protein
MKQYVVDEFRPSDYDAVRSFLDEHLGPSGIEGLYWKPIDNALLTPLQMSHTQCAPFFFGLALSTESLTSELLVRTRNRIHCDCMAYATVEQRNWLIGWVDDVLDNLGITI